MSARGKGDSCTTCAYSVVVTNDVTGKVGAECHRRAPRLFVFPVPKQGALAQQIDFELRSTGGWPPTKPGDWCGDFEAEPPKRES